MKNLLLEKKVELLEEVNREINSTILKKLTNQGNHLFELIMETQNKGKGIPCLLEISGPIDNPTIQMKWFPYDVISEITGTKINMVYTGE